MKTPRVPALRIAAVLRPSRPVLLSLLALLCGRGAAEAASVYWKGLSDNTWTGANWASDAAGNVSSVPPDATSDVIFTASNAANQAGTGLGNNFTIHNLTVNSSAGAVEIGTGTKTLTISGNAGTGITVSNAILTISVNLTLAGASNTIETDNFNQTTVSGVIAGSNGLIKEGNGNLRLTGTNTYTGGTTVNNGYIDIGNGGATGSISGNLAITTGGAVFFSRSDSLTYSGVISGAGGMAQLGVGTLTLSGASTAFNGTTEVAAGTLALGSAEAIGSTGLINLKGGTLQYTASNATDYSSRFSAASSTNYSIDTNGRDVTFASGLSGNRPLTVYGSAPGSILRLVAANTYTGGTVINSGSIFIENGGSIPGNVAINGGAL